MMPSTPVRADSFHERDGLVVAAAYAAGACAAAAAVAVAVALAAYGWKDIGWVLTASGAQGLMRALGTTGVVVLIALPVTSVVAAFAAAGANDASIGGFAGVAVRESIEWASGIPPVVIGLAVFFCAVAVHSQNAIAAATLALVLLNLPNATARLTRAFAAVSQDAREAAAALGASPVASFFGLVRPSAMWAVAAALLALTAQMIGETSAVATAISASDGPEPLSVQIWRYASNASIAGTEAASCIVLVLGIGLFAGLSRACARRTVQPNAASR
jgi:phosphate transport system permease protein